MRDPDSEFNAEAAGLPGPGDPFNAGAALLERAAARGDEIIYRLCGDGVEDAELCGRDLATLAARFQAGFSAAGLMPGQRVLLLLLDAAEFPAAFLGAMRGGLIPIPVSTLLRAKDIGLIARDADVAAAVIDRRLPDELAEPGLYPDTARLFRSDDPAWDRSRDPGDLPVASTRAEDPAFWLYTSGTTGRPKGVIHRQIDLPYTAETYGREILGIGPGKRLLSAAKLFFAYGLGNALTFPLWLGADCVLYADRPTPDAMFDLLARHEADIFFGVPTLYAAMLASPNLPKALPALSLAASAGEALPAAIYQRFLERFQVEILDGIGSTEMLHIFLSNRSGSVRPGSSGRPVSGYRVRVVDESDRDVPPGGVGELLAYGESAARSYHNRPEVSERTMFSEGWLRTGDRYRLETDGNLSHLGRQDDLLKVSGQWVSPLEVESSLIDHPAVLEAAVVAALDDDGLTKPKAFVVLKPEQSASDALAAELREHVKAQLTPHKYPRWIDFVDDLPKTATGKIQRFALRKT